MQAEFMLAWLLLLAKLLLLLGVGHETKAFSKCRSLASVTIQAKTLSVTTVFASLGMPSQPVFKLLQAQAAMLKTHRACANCSSVCHSWLLQAMT